jgi:hypothetical protein
MSCYLKDTCIIEVTVINIINGGREILMDMLHHSCMKLLHISCFLKMSPPPTKNMIL